MRIGDIAARVEHGERVVGTHWWNPPYLVPLVEVVQSDRSAAGAVARTIELLRSVGKTPVHVRRDVPGFIGNRLQHALWRQAFELVDAGVCDADDIDTVIKASFGRRLAVLGPMENADLVGSSSRWPSTTTSCPRSTRPPSRRAGCASGSTRATWGWPPGAAGARGRRSRPRRRGGGCSSTSPRPATNGSSAG